MLVEAEHWAPQDVMTAWSCESYILSSWLLTMDFHLLYEGNTLQLHSS